MNNKKQTIKELVVMSFATLIIAAAVFFFLMPSHAAVSSISGLAIVLSNIMPLKISMITMILNVILLIAGFILCGNEFGFKTVYTSILLPVFLAIFEFVFPDFTSISEDPILDVACYIFVVSIGLSILFNMNASSGGIDIIAKILNRYLHMDIGRAMSLCGMVIALSSAFFYDKKIVVLSVLGTYLNGMVLDHFIFGQNVKRRVCIISKDKEDEVRNWIVYTLNSGATIYQAKGAFDGMVRNEIITIVDKAEYQKLMDYLTREVPDAFVTVYNVNDMRYIPKK